LDGWNTLTAEPQDDVGRMTGNDSKTILRTYPDFCGYRQLVVRAFWRCRCGFLCSLCSSGSVCAANPVVCVRRMKQDTVACPWLPPLQSMFESPPSCVEKKTPGELLQVPIHTVSGRQVTQQNKINGSESPLLYVQQAPASAGFLHTRTICPTPGGDHRTIHELMLGLKNDLP
jgi:hypothetical protein